MEEARHTRLDMANSERSSGPEDVSIEPDGSAFKPRGYQLALLEESLRRNIIVALPTGSGKTLIATLRAREALERSHASRIVWFCAPKVQLARQQAEYMSKQLPMFRTRLLLGSDNCDFWSEYIWDEVLRNTHIVVSTYAVSAGETMCSSG